MLSLICIKYLTEMERTLVLKKNIIKWGYFDLYIYGSQEISHFSSLQISNSDNLAQLGKILFKVEFLFQSWIQKSIYTYFFMCHCFHMMCVKHS